MIHPIFFVSVALAICREINHVKKYVCWFSIQYNTKDSSLRLAYEAQPRPRAISTLSGETIVKVACGNNHTGASQHSIFCSHLIRFSVPLPFSYFVYFVGSSCCRLKWICLHVCITVHFVCSCFLCLILFLTMR